MFDYNQRLVGLVLRVVVTLFELAIAIKIIDLAIQLIQKL